MPEIVADRIGSLFYHRDTRLAETGHPVVEKSVDLADLGARYKRHQIRFDYAHGGDRRLYVEISVYKPRPGTHGVHFCLDVQDLLDGARPDSLRKLTKLLRVPQKEVVGLVIGHANLPN